MRQIDRYGGVAPLLSTLGTAPSRVGQSLAPRPRAAPSLTGRRLRRALETVRLWQERIRGRTQLVALDDHLLRDIGITRLQAEAEAHKPFWRA